MPENDFNPAQKTKDFISKIINNRSVIKKRFVRRELPVVFFFLILILLWGWFYGIYKAPWPEQTTKMASFPEGDYLPASEYYNLKKVSYLDLTQILNDKFDKFIDIIVANPKSTKVSKIVFSVLNNIYVDKKSLIVVKKTDASKFDQNKLSILNSKIKKYKKSVDSLNIIISEKSYFERSKYIKEKESYEKKYTKLIKFRIFLTNYEVIPQVYYSYTKRYIPYTFVAGRYKNLLTEKDQYIFTTKSVKPVFNSSLLENAGASFDEDAIDNEESNFEKTVELHESDYEKKKDSVISKIDKVISAKRSTIRMRFYNKWFSIYINFIVSYYLFLLLREYYKIIRRKGLPKKGTHEIYFATNTTSKVFRWLALIGIKLGQFLLVIYLLILLFSSNLPFKIVRIDSLWSGFVNPTIFVVLVIIMTWGLILQSEFFCFVSNIYHLFFEKAYHVANKRENND